MPKQRITKEAIVETAFEIARSKGMGEVMVRSVADRLGCSVQPVYSYCGSIEGLRREVVEKTVGFVREYAEAHIDKNDLFRSTGRAYISLAKEEPELFAIFILHRREGISSLEDLYESEANPGIAEVIAKELNIDRSLARQLHLNMLIYTIGIGTVFSVTSPGIPAEEIYGQQERACEAFMNYLTDNGG